MFKDDNHKRIVIGSIVLLVIYFITDFIAEKQTEREKINENNPYLENRKTDAVYIHSIYEIRLKRIVDKILSFSGLVLLSPLYLFIALAIYLEDKGPVLFNQVRVGKNKEFFVLHKFRSMKISTPHDIPTHMLDRPEQYITKVGKFLRKSSLDELPQIWDIFRGKMSIIGPRPALFNQTDLLFERDKYDANDIMPGLTGLAQISGRDELKIADKARMDGEYVQILRSGSRNAVIQDIKCFVGTVGSVLRCDGVMEGSVRCDAGFENYAYKKKFCIDKNIRKKVLITGANSYVGENFKAYAEKKYQNLEIDTVDMEDNAWHNLDFSIYDTVFHVAGIAHSDVEKVSDKEKRKYYAVNSDLAVEAGKKCKESGVKQFIFMSSMIIYGDSIFGNRKKVIDETTIPSPTNFYGDSKWKGDVEVRNLQSPEFHVAVLRPPMIYGYGSKGNYQMLAKMAKKLPVFPNIKNSRSILYIDNLCEFVCLLILSGEGGIYFPQNKEYTSTTQIAEYISKAAGNHLLPTNLLNPIVKAIACIPGKTSKLTRKAFGNCIYSQKLSQYDGLDYAVVDLKKSIEKTENRIYRFGTWENSGVLEDYSVLMSVYKQDSPEYVEESIESMLKQTVLCKQFVLVEDGPVNCKLDEKIKYYEMKYPSLFTVVRLEQNIGLGRALDEGLKYCECDLVARMDADDISLPERCEKLLKLFQENVHLCMAGTNIDEFCDNPSNITSRRIVPSKYEDICRFMRRRSPFNHPTVMYRKSEVLRCGGYGPMRRKQDLDLFARMLNQNCYALNINESLLLFRANRDSYKRKKSWEYCSSYIEVQRMNYKRGYCSAIDFIIVLLGQLIMYAAPESVTRILSDCFLRQKLPF